MQLRLDGVGSRYECWIGVGVGVGEGERGVLVMYID